jgi:hypothetical protein
MVGSGRGLANEVVLAIVIAKHDALELIAEIDGSQDAFCVL